MAASLEKRLSEEVNILKGLIASLPLEEEQKKVLSKNIHDRRFTINSFPLSEGQVKLLNIAIGEAYKAYDDAYHAAKSCPAVSEWMTDPVNEVAGYWNNLIQ